MPQVNSNCSGNALSLITFYTVVYWCLSWWRSWLTPSYTVLASSVAPAEDAGSLTHSTSALTACFSINFHWIYFSVSLSSSMENYIVYFLWVQHFLSTIHLNFFSRLYCPFLYSLPWTKLPIIQCCQHPAVYPKEKETLYFMYFKESLWVYSRKDIFLNLFINWFKLHL